MNPASLNDMATLWAPAVFRACWQGALAVGVVWLLCRLPPRLSPGMRSTLWWLVCAKILLGLFAIPWLPVAVLPAEPTQPELAQQVAIATTPTDYYVKPAAGVEYTPPPMPVPMVVAAAPEPMNLQALLLLLWGGGVLVLLALAGREQLRIQRLIGQARPCEDPLLLAELTSTDGLKRLPPVLISSTLPGSLVVGLWKPKVVLAEADLADLGPTEKRALLAHELAHIRRGDLWLGMLPNIARTVFFFNPFVWLACREYELAREAACDAESLRVSGMPPADYGRLLLKLSLPPAGPALRPGVAALGVASPHARVLLRRLHGLQRLKDEGVLPQWCSLLVLALVGMLLSLTPTRARLHSLIEPPAYAPTAPMEVEKAAAMTPVIAKAVSMPEQAIQVGQPVPEDVAQTGQTAMLASAPTTIKEGQPVMKLSLKPSSQLSRTVSTAAAIATVGASTMMATKTASAQETPPIPAVPPAPAAAPVVAIPAPETPATPEVPVLAVLQARKYQYTLRMGTSYSSHVSDKSTAQGQRKLAEAQPGDCMVVDRDGKRYLITDTATLRQIKDNYAAVEAKGKQMELKGKDMEKMSAPMEALGKQMEALGKIMEARGKEMGVLGEKMGSATTEAERAAIQEQMKAIREQMKMPADDMRALGKKMREQGDKMRIPGNEMREMGNQIRAAVKEAEERMVVILDNAFKNNLAVEQAGSVGQATGEISLD
ncbi:MAG: M56 family metallopeptidase [Armatimonas sp.]